LIEQSNYLLIEHGLVQKSMPRRTKKWKKNFGNCFKFNCFIISQL